MSSTLTAISAAHIDGNEIGYGMFILALIGLVSSFFVPRLLSDDIKNHDLQPATREWGVLINECYGVALS